MNTITIVLTNLPGGKGVTVQTDGAPPSIGRPLNPAEALAVDLLRTCKLQANSVQYGQQSASLAGELVQALHA